MAPDIKQLALLLSRKWVEWGRFPGGAVAYIERQGSDALALELAKDPALHLAKICGIFTNPPEKIMVDAIKAVLGLSDPWLGGVAMILSTALLKACEQRRYFTQQQARTALGMAAIVTLGVLGIAGIASQFGKSDR